jgi:hypothetical protein
MSFNKLWDAYKTDPQGNPTKINGDCSNYTNQCAMRLSRAFGLYDQIFPDDQKTFSSDEYKYKEKAEPVCKADGFVHARGAESLANYLIRQSRKPGSTFKMVKIFKPSSAGTGPKSQMAKNARSHVQGKKGVIFFDDCWGGSSSRGDHIDLWNGSETKSGEYFEGASEIWFFEYRGGPSQN